MTIFTGGPADDTWTGGSDADEANGNGGNDTLKGGDGSDTLSGGAGNDWLEGESGNDMLRDEDGGNDCLFGGDGKDFLSVIRYYQGVPSDSKVELHGGVGDDFLSVSSYAPGVIALIDAGSGNDQIDLNGAPVATVACGDGDDLVTFSMNEGSYDFSLGSGRDTLYLYNEAQFYSVADSIVIRDFAVGDDGDVIDLPYFLLTTLQNWDPATNPFATGHLRLAQDGANTALQFDRDGGGDGYVTLIVFNDVQSLTVTAANLGGYSPDGAAAPEQTINGTDAANVIEGGFGDDLIEGLDGDDEIYGDLGNDRIYGGAGNDRLEGNFGSDLLEGGAGDDQLFGSQEGGDTLRGGEGNDYLSISRIVFESRPILLDGGAGDDTFLVSADRGNDSIVLVGGSGADSFQIAGPTDASINAGDGDDQVNVYRGGVITVDLGQGRDKLIVGEAGSASGVVTLAVLAPDDRVQLASPGFAAQIIQRGADAVIQLDPDGPMPAQFQDLVVVCNTNASEIRFDQATGQFYNAGSAAATAGNDTLVGGDSANVLNGLAGDDQIYGEGGNDTLEGGAGDDTLYGGLGDDTYRVDAGDTVVEYAGEGADRLLAATDYVLAEGLSIETLATTANGGTAAIDLTGNELANSILGNAGNNILNGAAGNDVLSGVSGTDSFIGGTGDDQIYVDSTGDIVVEAAGGGNDKVLTSVTYALGAAAEVETLSTTNAAGTAAINLTGNAFANSLLGNAGNNILNGGAGNDVLSGLGGTDTCIGGTGDDQIYVDSSTDVVVEGAGGGNDKVLTSVSFVLRTGVQVETVQTTNTAGTTAISLLGNEFANALLGNAGANTINGGTGTDVMSGFAGNDVYYVDNAQDQVYELNGSGTDRIFTSTSYTLRGGSFVETISTTNAAGTEAINLGGNETVNALLGNAGANILNGGGGADTLSGYGGNDQYYVDNAADQVYEAAGGGTDRIFASASYALRAGSEVETISTTNAALATAINLSGNAFANTIYGNAGANILNGGAGADILSGFAGNDSYYVDNAADQVFEAAGGGTDRVFASVDYTLAAAAQVETLSTDNNAGTAGIDLTGNALANTIYGNAGANILNGGAGADILSGLGGNDSYYVDNAADQVSEAANGGTDRIFASLSYALAAGLQVETLSTTDAAGTSAINLTGNAFANELIGNAGANILNGGTGADNLTGYGGNDTYYVDNAGDQVFEAASGGTDLILASASYALRAAAQVETISTINAAATTAIDLAGNEFVNAITGNAGGNILNGGGGADSLTGLGGNDSYYVDDAGDKVFEAAGGGTDRVYASVSYTLAAGIDVETLSTANDAGTEFINLTGNEKNNVIYGNAGYNTIDGGAGADIMYGGSASDIFYVDDAGDQVFGGGDIWTSVSFSAPTGYDVAFLRVTDSTGTAAIDLTGNETSNWIWGNNGVNVIDGGGGSDILEGFLGADTFVFSTALGGGNVDYLSDFAGGTDKIALDDAVFAGLGLGALDPSAFVTGTAAQDADDRIIYNASTGALYFDVDGTGVAEAIQFAINNGRDFFAAPTAADFIVY